MTAVQHDYAALRDTGRGHHAAIRELSRRYGLDAGTVARSLNRADGEDRRNGLRARWAR